MTNLNPEAAASLAPGRNCSSVLRPLVCTGRDDETYAGSYFKMLLDFNRRFRLVYCQWNMIMLFVAILCSTIGFFILCALHFYAMSILSNPCWMHVELISFPRSKIVFDPTLINALSLFSWLARGFIEWSSVVGVRYTVLSLLESFVAAFKEVFISEVIPITFQPCAACTAWNASFHKDILAPIVG